MTTAGIDRLVLVTLDSCRLDIAQQVTSMWINRFPLRAGLCHGSFTLPSHVALFNGYPPALVHEESGANPGSTIMSRLPIYKRESRYSTADRGTVDGLNLVDGLRRSGFETVGAGGVRWFQTQQLQTGFTRFFYKGPLYTAEDKGLPDWRSEDYILNHGNALVEAVAGKDQWLLFVNAAETHAPYMSDRVDRQHQIELARFRNGKDRVTDADDLAFINSLRLLQAKALEIALDRVKSLFDALPAGFHFLITSDHGEVFGEDGLWGHVFAHPAVMNVPVWEGFYE